MRVPLLLVLLTFAAPAKASLIGVSFNTDETAISVWRIDPVALSADPIGRAGLSRLNSLAERADGTLVTIGGREVYDPEHDIWFTQDYLAKIDPITGEAQLLTPIGAWNFFDLAFAPDGTLYGIQRPSFGTAHLWTIDTTTGVPTSVGSTSFVNAASIAFAPNGRLYGWDAFKGLLEIDPMTGESVRITQGPDQLVEITSLLFLPGGGLIGVGSELFDIDVTMGIAASRGALTPSLGSFISIRGIALVPEPSGRLLVALALVGLSIRRVGSD